MEFHFAGISLMSISKQLNTEISVLLQDVKQIKQKLNDEILAVIQQICKETVDLDLTSYADTKLNLCHLIGLMITYECCIVLRSILSADPKPSDDSDFDVIQFFQRQLSLNRTNCPFKDKHKVLDHTINRCKQQNPIILLYEQMNDEIDDVNGVNKVNRNNAISPNRNNQNHQTPNSVDIDDDDIRYQFTANAIRFDLSMTNNKIYTKCKLERSRRCPLRDIPILNALKPLSPLSRSVVSPSSSTSESTTMSTKSEPFVYSSAAAAVKMEHSKLSKMSNYRSAPNLSKLGQKLEIRSKSENDIKDKRRRVRIPKSSLSPFADKNYHQFGRRHNLPVYGMEEIAKHQSMDDCWIIVDNLVLDVTAFLPYHPASYQCILRKSGGGQVCDLDFKFHSKSAQNLFWKFVIGRVQRDTSCIVM